MSLVDIKLSLNTKGQAEGKIRQGDSEANLELSVSDYKPSDIEIERLSTIRKHFMLSDVIMRKPRREWNDMSTLQRLMIDTMAFNNYLPNDGDPDTNDYANAWKSRASRPIIRNKVVSIAAHATSRLIYPKVYSYNQQDEEDKMAGIVMSDLIEWVGEKYNYEQTSLNATITALFSPAAITYNGYEEVYRNVKRKQEDGTYKIETIKDEDRCGFISQIVPVDEMFISNFYERDIQKQDWLIWRRVQSWDSMAIKYGQKENFKYVKPGVQVIYNDANTSFYETYDSNMRQEMVEEVIYWNKDADLFLTALNGVLMTDPDNCIPRDDKQYPFTKFYYEPVDEGRCFYGMSLSFKMSQDAKIANTLYQMIIDGSYLTVFPALVQTGGDAIGSDVIIPGSLNSIKDPEAKIFPITGQVPNGLNSGMSVLNMINTSLNESSQEPLQQGLAPTGDPTARQIMVQDQNADTILGLFLKQITDFVKQQGKLIIGDVIQYLTIGDVMALEGAELTYKTFILHDKNVGGNSKTRNIKMTMFGDIKPGSDEEMAYSGNLWEKAMKENENGNNVELIHVRPDLFAKLKYYCIVTPDLVKPKTEAMQTALNLKAYSMGIVNPILDQEEITKTLFLGSFDATKRNVDKFIKKAEPMPQQQPGQGNPATPGSMNNLVEQAGTQNLGQQL